MRISKKAQGISMNAIIVAAIALIVLVVLVAIFTGRLGTWGQGVTTISKNECTGPAYNGACRDAVVTGGCDKTREVRAYGATGCLTGQICCIAKGE